MGPRLGKFRRDGRVKPTPPSNVLLVTLGVFILWLGWFGFNGGSQLALGSALDAVAMSVVLVNTNLGAAAGVVTALAVSRPILGRIDLFAGLNGAIAGLVAVTAWPANPDHFWAIVVGAIGGLLCTGGLKLLERLKLDDVVGAIPAHLIAGVWGTLAVSFTAPGEAQFHVQLMGIAAIGGFVFGSAFHGVVRTGQGAWGADIEAGGRAGPGCRGAGHGVLPRVRAYAGRIRRGNGAEESRCSRVALQACTGWAGT